MNQQPLKRDWFYWFMTFLTVTQLPLSALFLLDFVLHPLAPGYDQSSASRLFSALVIVPIVMAIALLVIRRAPGNVTGLFLLLWATAMISDTGRQEVLILRSLSFGWVGIWFLPLFFPNGRAHPRRFEPYIRGLCVSLALSVMVWTVSAPQISISERTELPNPLLIPALKELFPIVSTVDRVLLIATLVIILPSLIARYHGSDQRIRQQLKWLAWVFFGIIVTTIPILITGITLRDPQSLSPRTRFLVGLWGIFVSLGPFFAIGIAILRHNLYDIDIIIRKTLVYSLLTTILGAVYFGGVILAQQLFRAITGETTDVAIVLSTLLIAALFVPVRRRVQRFIDRRFYRRKYDAEKTLVAFGATVRSEVDLDQLTGELLKVVEETLQPESVSLWLRK